MVFEIYNGKTALITGHTGFKGSWLSIWLNKLGVKVVGYSLKKYQNDCLFRKTQLKKKVIDKRGDIRNFKRLRRVFLKYRPKIVFHLAAQPLVRKSYDKPLETIDTNVLGTANILECIKEFDFVKAAVIITTDKVYKNKENKKGYKEDDELGGYDPYSISKVCTEMVINSYKNCLIKNKLVASVRAGNIIGGGDFAEDRLIPDCIKALKENKEIKIRNPSSIRPWQFILEPLYGYLLIGEKLLEGKTEFAEAWNFGPDKDSIVTVKTVVESVINNWGTGKWIDISNPYEKKHETKVLLLDSTKAKKRLGWSSSLSFKESIKNTIDWYKRSENKDVYNLCIEQIEDYTKKVFK